MPKNEENNSFLIYFWRGRGRKKDSFFWSRGWDGANTSKDVLKSYFGMDKVQKLTWHWAVLNKNVVASLHLGWNSTYEVRLCHGLTTGWDINWFIFSLALSGIRVSYTLKMAKVVPGPKFFFFMIPSLSQTFYKVFFNAPACSSYGLGGLKEVVCICIWEEPVWGEAGHTRQKTKWLCRLAGWNNK